MKKTHGLVYNYGVSWASLKDLKNALEKKTQREERDGTQMKREVGEEIVHRQSLHGLKPKENVIEESDTERQSLLATNKVMETAAVTVPSICSVKLAGTG